MTATPPGSRGLSPAWRTCLLLAALLLVAAVYLLVVPLERVSAEGVPFDCGSALLPADGGFARSVCGDLNARRQIEACAVGVAALVLAGGGWLAYGRPRDPAVDAESDDPGREPTDQ